MRLTAIRQEPGSSVNAALDFPCLALRALWPRARALLRFWPARRIAALGECLVANSRFAATPPSSSHWGDSGNFGRAESSGLLIVRCVEVSSLLR
eukprot:CAMPEP_0181266270 /NCGR_PEP_ID=MMETSP1097-20121128/4193_1 /TAXON_ID=35684 /ORGANISM="Pseudopedinella elastica, Strain CCMP716" /LENGTH=94 /DNA_ID=CAMNT_0023365451 /DNA_START=44 /DNA_END=325 /DNA_ORIENTATION=+